MKKYEYDPNGQHRKRIETDKKAKEFVAKVKAHLFSALQTFFAGFFVSFGLLLKDADFSQMDENAFYAFIFSAILTAGRSGIKLVFEAFFPKK